MKKKVVIFEYQDIRFASRSRKESLSLNRNGYDVTLVGFNRELKEVKNVYNQNGIRIIECGNLLKNNNYSYAKFINIFYLEYVLLKLFLNESFDIFHLHNLKLFIPAVLIKIFKRNSILIYDAHELNIEKRHPRDSFRNLLFRILDMSKEYLLIHLADQIIQASEMRAKYFSKFFKVPLPVTIENHDNIQNVRTDVLTVREIIGCSEDTIIMVFTGNVTIAGNQAIDTVIKSLKSVRREVVLCLMGRCEKSVKTEIDKIIEDNRLKGRVYFIPPVLSEDVVSTISGADIAVIPIRSVSLNSEYSALNKLSQSLMAGLPIVVSHYDNLQKVINEDNSVGELFDPNLAESIALAINKLLSRDITQSGKNARKLAVSKYNWEIEEKRLIELYNNL